MPHQHVLRCGTSTCCNVALVSIPIRPVAGAHAHAHATPCSCPNLQKQATLGQKKYAARYSIPTRHSGARCSIPARNAERVVFRRGMLRVPTREHPIYYNTRRNTRVWRAGILALYHSIPLSLYHSITLSLYHSITLALYHSITLSLYHSITRRAGRLIVFRRFPRVLLVFEDSHMRWPLKNTCITRDAGACYVSYCIARGHAMFHTAFSFI